MKAAADAHRRRHPKDKPLPPIPHGISDTRSLQTDVCVGFPKRPRNRPASHERHPSIEAANALPDGLYKGKLKLEKNMLPSIDWAGLSVKVRLIIKSVGRRNLTLLSILLKYRFFLGKTNYVLGSPSAFSDSFIRILYHAPTWSSIYSSIHTLLCLLFILSYWYGPTDLFRSLIRSKTLGSGSSVAPWRS